MKYFLFFLLIGLPFNAFAQSLEDEPPQYLFKIQGGIVYDTQGEKDYAGFNYLNLGLSRLKSEKIYGFEIELMAYDQVVQRFGFIPIMTTTGIPSTMGISADWNCKRKAVELSAFRLYSIFGNIKNGVYLGPFISGAYKDTRLNPIDESLALFPRSSKNFGLGLGPKLDYYAQLTNKLSLTLGLKFNVMSFNWNENYFNNPLLNPLQQVFSSSDLGFLEGKVPVMIGLSYTI